MASDLFFYQLMLIALLWLCVMLHWVWPSDLTLACPTIPSPPPRTVKIFERTILSKLTVLP
jgi:hypothetical protein